MKTNSNRRSSGSSKRPSVETNRRSSGSSPSPMWRNGGGTGGSSNNSRSGLFASGDASVVSECPTVKVRNIDSSSVASTTAESNTSLTRLNFFSLKVHGRDDEKTQLQKCYTQARANQGQIALLEGPAGIGKSSMVETLRKSVTKDGAYMVKGQFNHYTTGEPFSGLIDALSDLCVLIAHSSDPATKRALLEAIENDVSILQRLVPTFDQITKSMNLPDDEDFKNQQSFDRFRFAVENFVVAVAQTNTVVFCLEDLHCADQSSLQVIRILTRSHSLNNVLVVLSYRSDSIKTETFLDTALPIENIVLQPLPSQTVVKMLAEIFLTNTITAELRRLADVVTHKTHGNPYSIIQFLEMLQAEDLLVYNQPLSTWNFNVDEIDKSTEVCDSVYAALEGKIRRLRSSVRSALILASFLGFQFKQEDMEYLVADDRLLQTSFVDAQLKKSLNGLKQHSIKKHLKEAEKDGLVSRIMPGRFTFSHDAIQQAFYSLVVDGGDKERIHYALGMRYAEEMQNSPKQSSSLLFQTTEHLNSALSFFIQEEDALQLVQINYKSTLAALRKGTYTNALRYAKVARDLLRERVPLPWARFRRLVLQIYNYSCELEYLTGNFVNTQRAFDTISAKVGDTPHEMIFATRVWCRCLRAKGKLDEAIDYGCDFLQAELGEPLKKAPNAAQVSVNTYKVKRLLKDCTDKSVLELSDMKDPIMEETVRLIGLVSSYALIAQRTQFFIVGCLRILQLTLQHGLTANSSYALAIFGCVAHMMGDYDDAVRYGNLALQVMERMNDFDSTARTNTIVHATILHLKIPFHDLPKPFFRAYEAAVSVGNTEMAVLAAAMHAAAQFNVGTNLGLIVNDMVALTDRLKHGQANAGELTLFSLPYWQASLNLMGGSSHPVILNGEAMQEDVLVREASKTNNQVLLRMVGMVKVQVACYFGYWDMARGIVKETQKEHTKFFKINFLHVVLEFFIGMIYYETTRRSGKRKYLKDARQALKLMEKYCDSMGCPNTLPFMLVLQAEDVAVSVREKDFKAVVTAYNNAIAGSSSLPHIRALVYERAATVLHESQWNCEGEIRYYLKMAIEAYTAWGAEGKVQDIKGRFGMYLTDMDNGTPK